MKTRPLASAIFFLSSYAPLAAIIAVKDFDFAAGRLKHPYGVLVVVALAVLSAGVLYAAVRQIRAGVEVTVRSVSNKSGELVNYTIPYMISFFAFDLGNWNEVVAFLAFLALMYVLTVRTQNIFINPLLAILGYSLYDVAFRDGDVDRQGALLAREELHAGDRAVLQRVARFFYIVTAINPEV